MMKRLFYLWMVTAVIPLFFSACITINQTNQYTDIAVEPVDATAVATTPLNIRPSPTPVAAFPGIIYETAVGYWQINERGQEVQLAELPHTGSLTTRNLDDFGLADEGVHNAFLSPDGNWLAVTQLPATDSPTVWLVSRSSQQRHLLGDGFDPVWSPDGRHLIYNTPGHPQLVLVSDNPYVIHMNLPIGSKVVGWLDIINR
jgi:hypothetical protein